MAHRVILLPRSNSVAFGLKQTLGRIEGAAMISSALEVDRG
jgi:hypothetical protein